MSEKQKYETELVPVPMDIETIGRLARFAKAIGKHPIEVAGMLLADLLADDAFWNAAKDAAKLN